MPIDARLSRRSFGLMAVVGTAGLSGCDLLELTGESDPTTAPTPVVEEIPTVALATEPDPADSPLLVVDRVEVLVMESFPVQVRVEVFGSLPDPCTEIGDTTQRRDGNAIVVTIATVREPDVLCAQVITPVEERVMLDGDFPAGDYVVEVNGVTRSFRV